MSARTEGNHCPWVSQSAVSFPSPPRPNSLPFFAHIGQIIRVNMVFLIPRTSDPYLKAGLSSKDVIRYSEVTLEWGGTDTKWKWRQRWWGWQCLHIKEYWRRPAHTSSWGRTEQILPHGLRGIPPYSYIGLRLLASRLGDKTFLMGKLPSLWTLLWHFQQANASPKHLLNYINIKYSSIFHMTLELLEVGPGVFGPLTGPLINSKQREGGN